MLDEIKKVFQRRGMSSMRGEGWKRWAAAAGLQEKQG
jgi:hypothetical protein